MTKEKLYALVHESLEAKIALSQQEIKDLQFSANDETKSSAGDKYETGRSMVQLEIEKSTAHLAEAQKQLNTLEQFKPQRVTSSSIQRGSLVMTSQGNYYLIVSAGIFMDGEVQYYVISPASPIGQKLLGLSQGQSFTFNNKAVTILSVS